MLSRPGGNPETDRDEEPDIALVLPSVPESLSVARQFARVLAEHCGADEARNEEIVLAVGEACANVVSHAYGDGDDGPIWLGAWLGRDRLELVVRDESDAFLPHFRDEPPGLGLGIPLIIALADEVRFRCRTGGSNEVMMRFDTGGPR